MTTKKRILLPIDFSEDSMRAFAPVGALAQSLHARITLMHVIPDQPLVPPTEAPVPQVAIDPEEVGKQVRERLLGLRSRFPDDVELDVDVVLEMDVSAAIVNYAKKNGVDWIAMATHGRSGLSRAVLGSTAESVLRHTSVPMFLYPPQR